MMPAIEVEADGRRTSPAPPYLVLKRTCCAADTLGSKRALSHEETDWFVDARPALLSILILFSVRGDHASEWHSEWDRGGHVGKGRKK